MGRVLALLLGAGIASLGTSALAQPNACTLEEAAGFTEPSTVAEVAAREPGIVAKVLVEDGDQVKSGQILAELDKRLAQAELDAARARAQSDGQMAVAQAKLDQAKRRMDEIAKLQTSRAVRPLELMTTQAELAIAEAEFQSAQDARRVATIDADVARAKLDLLEVRAPFDGVVKEVHRKVSELVGMGGDARVVTMFELDPLYVDFFVPVGCVGNATSKGSRLSVHLARLDQTLQAVVRTLDPSIDAPTGMRRIKLEIANADYALLSGERLTLTLPIGVLER